MNSENRIKVTSDPEKNILKISFAGKITTKDMPYLKEQISKELVHMNKGFSLLTDLTDLISMETKCAPFIKKVMELMRDQGIELVVRIIPDPSKDIGLNIMSRFHYPSSLRVVTVNSHEEANLKLSEKNSDPEI